MKQLIHSIQSWGPMPRWLAGLLIGAALALGILLVSIIHKDYHRVETTSMMVLIYVNGKYQKATCYENSTRDAWDCVVDGKHIVVPKE